MSVTLHRSTLIYLNPLFFFNTIRQTNICFQNHTTSTTITASRLLYLSAFTARERDSRIPVRMVEERKIFLSNQLLHSQFPTPQGSSILANVSSVDIVCVERVGVPSVCTMYTHYRDTHTRSRRMYT